MASNLNLTAFAKTLTDLASRKGDSPETVPYAKVEKMIGRKLGKAERSAFRMAWQHEVDEIIMRDLSASAKREAGLHRRSSRKRP